MSDTDKPWDVLRRFADELGIPEDAEPPKRAHRIVIALGPAVMHTWKRLGHDPESLRWLALTLRYWAENTRQHADQADEEIRRWADELEPGTP